MPMFSQNSPQHCPIHLRSQWAIRSFCFFQPYSGVWCSFLPSSSKTRQVHLLSALTGWEEGTQEILPELLTSQPLLWLISIPTILIGWPPGLLLVQWSARNLWYFVNSADNLGAGGAREAVNKNKGARLQSQACGGSPAVAAWVRAGWVGCCIREPLLTLLEAPFHLKLSSLIFQSIDELL